jgi:microcin C transport system substrate-binding protein
MRHFRLITFLVVAVLFVTIFNSCGKSKRRITFDTQPVSIHQYETPTGADPTVPAELGGEGFTGEGWETSADYHLFGDENAEKGGSLIMSVQDFPATLRTVGKDANTTVNRMMETMMYESLLNLDPVTEEYIPYLATHWQISEDKMSYRFRINPDARWADGKPVTSEDVVATWKLMVDPGILEAYSNILYGSYEEPVAESKYIVSVKSKELNWRQFLYFSASLRILPAHYIGNIPGSQYLEKYQFEFVPGSGPYLIRLDDINKGQSIMIRRRSDYWAENERFNTGLNNFDLVRFEVVQDQSLEFEKFKKGEIDVIVVNRAQWWEERFDFPEYDRGIILKRRIFNEYPNGVQGIAFNMRKPPFDDVRLREAFFHLFNREMFNEKLFYNSYSMTHSFWPGSVYENPDNPKVDFNVEKAKTLLAEAGWSEKNSDGYLVKNGSVFELELTFYSQGADRYLTIFQEDLKNAGIKLNLRQIDGPTNFRLGNERNFSIISIAWGGLVIPNPESSMASNTADEPNTTNWPGIKDDRIDELLKRYNVEFNKEERVKIVREIDFIATNKYPYIFAWYAPYQRIAIQNKFGYPDWYLPRTENYLTIPSLWWNDPEKAAEYEDAKNDPNLTLEKGEVDQKFWTKVRSKLEAGESVDLDAIGAGASE